VKTIGELEKKLETIQGCLKTTDNEGDFEKCTGMSTEEVRNVMNEGKRKGIL